MGAIPAKGVLLAGQFDGTSYTTVSDRVSVSVDGFAARIVETTNLDSTSATHIVTGVTDYGTVSGSLQFDPDSTSHDDMLGLIDTPAAQSWRITWTDGTPATFTFSGILTEFSASADSVDDYVSADFTIQVSGDVTRA